MDVSSNEMEEPLKLEVSVRVEVFGIEWRVFYIGDSLVDAASTNNSI